MSLRWLLLMLVVFAVPSGSQAQWYEPTGFRSQHGDARHLAFGELSVFSGSLASGLGSAEGFALSPLFGGYFRVLDPLEVGFLWGFAYGDGNRGMLEGSAFETGNPYLHAAYRLDSDGFVVRIGGGLTLPLATSGSIFDADDVAGLLGLTVSAGMRGLWSFWLWLPDRLTLVLPNARIDFDLHENLVLAAESAFGVMFYTGDGDADTEVAWQLAGEVGGRFLEGILESGLRLQLVTNLTAGDGQDAAQLMAQPFFRAHLGPAFGEIRLAINLDNDLGFAFDQGRIWGLHFAGGARF